MVYDNIVDLFNDYIKNYKCFKEVVSPKEYCDIILNLKTNDYDGFFKELSKEKKVFITGKLKKSEKEKIKALLLKEY